VNRRIKIDLGIWIFISFPCVYSQISLGQSHSYLHYSIPEGLPSSEVYDVYQDRKGFIWFATDNGVVRYDGSQMETFQVNDGLTDPVVFGIIEDSKGRIWFRTFSGKICYYNNKKIHPYRFNDILSPLCKAGNLFSLYIDSLDNVWFGSDYAIGKIDSRGQVQKDNNEYQQLSFKKIDDRYLTAFLGIFESMDNVKVNGKSFPFHLNDKTHTRPINRTVSWRGEEYFNVGATIFKISNESIVPVFIAKDQIISLSKDFDDNLWIGYLQNGVERYQSFKDSKPFRFPFLDSKSVTCVLHDAQKGYWVSTLEDGVYYIPEFFLLTQTISNHKKIRTVFSRNQTLVGDDSGLASLLDQSGNLIIQKKFNSILSVFVDSNKNIWISTRIETYILDNRLEIKKVIPISLSNLTEDARGFIWGVSGFTILKFNLKGDVIFTFMDRVSRFISVSENNMYLYGRLGLGVLNHSLDEVKIPKYFEGLKISKVVELNKVFILVNTLGSGFYIVNKNDWTYQHYDSKRNFIADNVYTALLVDSTLWLGTEKGLAITNVQRLLSNNPSFRFYNKKNGLFGNRVAHLSYSKPNVWVYSDDSFSILPSNLLNEKDVTTFYLKDVLINNKVDSLETLDRLKFDQNNIQVNFGFIDLRNQNILIRYRLSALNNWNYATERNIRFFSLSPGNYFFELEYSTDNFHWMSAMKHPINISPQWWMNWRIQLTLFLILSLFSYLYYRRRIHRLREKQDLLKIINEQQHKLIRAELETLESERSRIAKDLHDSIGTNLAAIKLFLNSIFKKSNEPDVLIIETTLQETIQGTRDIIANLAPADLERFGLIAAIKIYTQRIKDQFNINFDVSVLGTEINQPEISIHLFRIIQELITNSLKYASAKKITITINFNSHAVKIRYEDDGVGFNINSISKGNGLLNIQSRVQILEGSIKFESSNNGVSYFVEVPLKINQS
jgi:signal transduction histidine kinase/ligand-binding sensor domain-containing protein